MAMMAITTNNSINVKPERKRLTAVLLRKAQRGTARAQLARRAGWPVGNARVQRGGLPAGGSRGRVRRNGGDQCRGDVKRTNGTNGRKRRGRARRRHGGQ